MKRIFSIGAALLLCSAAAIAQYTNILENGTNVTVISAWTNDTVWVGQTTTNNTLSIVDGGSVFSTNVFVGETGTSSNNTASVTGTGSWTIEDTLQIGIGISNTVSVGGGGTLSVGNLSLNPGNTFNLDSGGTFAIATNFMASTDGFNWNSGGELSVGGTLSGMGTTNLVVGGTTNAVYDLAGGRDLTLDGGTWDISGTNLVVGYDGSGSELLVKNTGTLSSATTYIGWDTNSANSAVTISDGSTWANSGDLWVGYGAGGSVFSVVNAGTNIMTGSAYIGNTNTANNQVRIEGTNSVWDIGGNLVIGNGSNSLDNSVSVSDGAKVLVGGDVTLNTGNTLSLASDGSIQVDGNMNIYSNATAIGSGTILFGTDDSELAFNGTGIGISTNLLFDGGVGNNMVSVNDGSFTVYGSSDLQYTNFQALTLTNSTLGGYGTLSFNSINMTGGTIDPSGVDSDTARLEFDGTFTPANGTVYSAQVYETRNDELSFQGQLT